MTGGNEVLVCVLMCGTLLGIATDCRASGGDFNGVVDGLEEHYGVSPHRVPMMGFVNLCARLATHGAVKGLKVAEFDHLGGDSVAPGELSGLIAGELGREWTAVVKDYEQHGAAETTVFVHPEGHAMHIVIANYEHGDLNLVRLEFDGDKASRWIRRLNDPSGRHNSDQATSKDPENAQ